MSRFKTLAKLCKECMSLAGLFSKLKVFIVDPPQPEFDSELTGDTHKLSSYHHKCAMLSAMHTYTYRQTNKSKRHLLLPQ